MTRTLWDVLGAIVDRWGRKGRRLPLPAMLAIAIAAMLASRALNRKQGDSKNRS